jgi:hypothetical protein
MNKKLSTGIDPAGFFTLSRSLLKSDIWRSGDDALLRVWVWCIGSAAWKDHTTVVTGNRIHALRRGQFITGKYRGATENSMPPSTFRRKLELLVKTGNLLLKSDHDFTLVTVCHYDDWQRLGGKGGLQVDPAWTSSGPAVDTTEQSKQGEQERGGHAPQVKRVPVKSNPPTKAQVWEEAKRYLADKGWSVRDQWLKGVLENFYSYYVGNNWKQGKNDLVSWQAALTRWVGSDYRKAQNASPSKAQAPGN